MTSRAYRIKEGNGRGGEILDKRGEIKIGGTCHNDKPGL